MTRTKTIDALEKAIRAVLTGDPRDDGARVAIAAWLIQLAKLRVELIKHGDGECASE